MHRGGRLDRRGIVADEGRRRCGPRCARRSGGRSSRRRHPPGAGVAARAGGRSGPCASPRSRPSPPACPARAPVAGSRPSPAKSSPGQTRCWWPVTTASMPSTAASWSGGVLDHRGLAAPASMPEWLRATTMSAPASRISGTQARGRLDDVADGEAALEVAAVPDHDLRRHEADQADAGSAAAAPAPSMIVRSRMHVGLEVQRVVARPGPERPARSWRRRSGSSAPALTQVEEVDAVVELVVAEGAGLVAEGVHAGDHRVDVAGLHARARRRCSRPSGCPAGSRRCRRGACWWPRRGSPR